MADREEVRVEVLTAEGWYRGYVTVPLGGRLLDFLNTKPPMIGLTHAVAPTGRRALFVTVNTDHVIAIQLSPEA